jgi:hypothetical protein
MTGASIHPLQAIPDTLGAAPLPGGIATVVRFIFQVPQWIQIGGAFLAVIVTTLLAVLLWRRRREIIRWFRTRPALVLGGIGVAVVAVAVVSAAFGMASWNYMMHDNAFCTGCHVMGPAFSRFSQSEHATLNCHDCHQQPITASMRQLVLWVAQRPEEIGEHAPVPNEVCGRCHNQTNPDSAWQRIAETAGHRIHLESDSSALANVQCTTCHGLEVHQFVPPDVTCGQSGCHNPESTRIVLGNMSAQQTSLHCAMCHDFRSVVGGLTPRQQASEALVPAAGDCLGCHDMQQVIQQFDARADPHRGVCGTCHNPHTQETPQAAWQTCASSGCHEDVSELTPFHRGIHASAQRDCSTCHRPHTWKAIGTDCRSCHTNLR